MSLFSCNISNALLAIRNFSQSAPTCSTFWQNVHGHISFVSSARWIIFLTSSWYLSSDRRPCQIFHISLLFYTSLHYAKMLSRMRKTVLVVLLFVSQYAFDVLWSFPYYAARQLAYHNLHWCGYVTGRICILLIAAQLLQSCIAANSKQCFPNIRERNILQI